MNLGILGLVFDIVGVLVITFVEIINPFYIRREDVKFFDKRKYCWNAWRPIYKNTKTSKWEIRWNHVVLVEGRIPPKYKLIFFGLILLLVGFILQVAFYLLI